MHVHMHVHVYMSTCDTWVVMYKYSQYVLNQRKPRTFITRYSITIRYTIMTLRVLKRFEWYNLHALYIRTRSCKWLTVTVSSDVTRVGSTVSSHTAAHTALSGGGLTEHRTSETVTTARHGLVRAHSAGCRMGASIGVKYVVCLYNSEPELKHTVEHGLMATFCLTLTLSWCFLSSQRKSQKIHYLLLPSYQQKKMDGHGSKRF